MNRKELRDDSLTTLARRHFIALFEISDGPELDPNSNDVLFVLDNMDIFDASGFFILIQERGIMFWFVVALRLFFGN